MLKSYLITAWRNLLRNRTLSIINLFGLSVSVAFCLLLFYHVRWEQSFDTFHVKKDRLYRAEMSSFRSKTAGGDDEKNGLAFPLNAGPDLMRNFPEVAAYSRCAFGIQQLVRAGASVFSEKQVVWADDNFFQLFSFRLLKGNARTALSSPENVVLSESTAKKYFGNEDPLGKTVSVLSDSNRVYRVSGVAVDAPANSSLSFGLIFPIESDPSYQFRVNEGFDNMMYNLIVELKPGTDRPAFEHSMNAWVKSYIKPFVDTVWYKGQPASVRDSYHWVLRPFADCHYNPADWGHYTNAKAIYQLVCIVVVILLLASLNYVLITVSNAAARSQEIGVRKVMGAGRPSVIFQSWVETLVIAGIAVGSGLLLSWLGIPLLRSIIGSGVSFSTLSWSEVIAAAVGLVLLLSVLAGYYPALLISRFKPLAVMKSFGSVRINPRFSRVLVVVQFTCCVVLMAAAFIIDRQMNFVINKDLGFDKDQVLIIHSPSHDGKFAISTRDRLYAFARTRPDVAEYSSMHGGPTGSHNNNGIMINGKQEWYQMMMVDYNYFELLKLKFVEGRGFSRDFPTDTVVATRPVVVNEAMMKLLGKDAKLGVYNKEMRATIIGVVKDYNFESLTQKIAPEQHRLSTWFVSDYLFKIKGGNVEATIGAFATEWKRITNGYPFSYDFLDAALRQRYEADMRWQKAMSVASIFAVVIACMGLFGLSAIAMANRTKEIGIRKVLGASVGRLVGMLATGFLSMVGLAILIAVPLAWWMMNKWLEDFAYRIAIQWWMFGLVGLMAVGVALVTVSFQVLRAARANPVDALRSE